MADNTAIVASLQGQVNISTANLWKGVSYMKHGSVGETEPAWMGHVHIFPTHGPAFLVDPTASEVGKIHASNILNGIRNGCTGFSGVSNKQVQFSTVVDGFASRKIDNVSMITKEIDQITLKIHEYDGFVIKNALEYWLDGILDDKVQRNHYHGLSNKLRYSTANHSMGVLVVVTDSSWSRIQDAAWYYNMIPTEVPFSHMDFNKGTIQHVEDYDISFKCNEERSKYVNVAAVAYMNNLILSKLSTHYDRHTFDIGVPVSK